MRMAVVALLLLLGACGADSDEPKAVPSKAATEQPAAVATTPAPTGVPVPAALSRFRCEPDGTGTYVARGVVANTTKAAVTFQVTVHVGSPGPDPQSARTKQVPKIAPGGSVDFEIDKIPAAPEGGTCHVQVLTPK